ncbi:MAG: DASH family cryptochrome [Candidatus Kapaibacteriota bacterium]
MKTIIHWFTTDLRLHDMPSLQAVKHSETLLPVYIFDTHQDSPSIHGFPRMGSLRKAFLEHSIDSLRTALQMRGSDLLILKGKPDEILPELVQTFDVDCIHVEEPIASEEVQLIKRIDTAISIPIHRFESRTLYQEKELPFALAQLPDIFTDFRKLMEASKGYDIYPVEETMLPSLPKKFMDFEHEAQWRIAVNYKSTDPRAAFRAIGGEIEGLKRLEYYTQQSHAIATYKSTRNGLIGDAYSSKFSPWLATGSLSARRIMQAINEYEINYEANESTYWMKFELLWREFFQWTFKKHGDACFRLEGIRGKKQEIKHDQSLIDAWRFGRTPDRFVNANMKELLLTGFMSNRGRQNVASYFVHNLKQDWRIGAEWFESQLIDYDVASNWGNWMYVAGVGNDPRQDRMFNTKKQAEMYDPLGEYQALWLHDEMSENEH